MATLRKPYVCRWCANTGDFTYHLDPARWVCSTCHHVAAVRHKSGMCNYCGMSEVKYYGSPCDGCKILLDGHADYNQLFAYFFRDRSLFIPLADCTAEAHKRVTLFKSQNSRCAITGVPFNIYLNLYFPVPMRTDGNEILVVNAVKLLGGVEEAKSFCHNLLSQRNENGSIADSNS